VVDTLAHTAVLRDVRTVRSLATGGDDRRAAIRRACPRAGGVACA
jgi:hypothetical protein